MPSTANSPDDAEDPGAKTAPAAIGVRRLQIIVAAVVLGAATGLAAVVFFYARRSGGPPLPPLTVELFDEQRAKWKAAPLMDYDIRIEVQGMQPAVYEVKVRNGAAIEALRNGRPLTQRRTWGTWSVDGMFATIAADVQHLRRREGGDDARAGALQVTLGAEFDDEHHYPTRYFRLEQVQFGNNRSANWEVTRFHELSRDELAKERGEEGGES